MESDRRTLFIIEDDLEIQNIYSSMFKHTEWEIIGQVYDGYEAKKLYNTFKEKPRIVICDIELPTCSGLEVAIDILKQHPRQKILFVSAKGSISEHFFESKNISILSKPFNVDDILTKLSKLSSA